MYWESGLQPKREIKGAIGRLVGRVEKCAQNAREQNEVAKTERGFEELIHGKGYA